MSLGSSYRSPNASTGSICAPSGLTDSEESDGEYGSPRFSFLAPSGLTDSDSEEEGEEVQSRPMDPSQAVKVSMPSPAQRAVNARKALARQLLLEATQRAVGQFDAAVLEIDAEEAEQLAAVDDAMRRLRAEDVDKASARLEAADDDRAAVLSRLQVVHQQKARQLSENVAAMQQVAAEKAAKEAAARKAAREAAERQRLEEERARQQAEEAARKAAEDKDRMEREAAAKKEAEAAAARAGQPQAEGARSAEASSGRASSLRVAPGAAEAEKQCWDTLKAAEDLVRPLVEDESQKKERRKLDKFITLNVQQISGTQQQVNAKATALVQFLRSLAGAPRAYALLQLAGRLASQCECQVALSHAFAFPLAEVAAAVAATHPDLAPILLAKLHHACVLAVPKLYVHYKGRDEAQYLRRMGYREVEVPAKNGGAPTKQCESTDQYAARMQGYMLFYGALVQSERQGNPHDLSHGWQYIARLLNSLPASRMSATALEAFLKTAGFRLNAAFGRQFHKLLAYIDSVFMPDLARQGDPDARAVHSRLRSYMHDRQFLKEPEGRRMPFSDISAREHA
ncbi:Nucleoporin GLE1 [Coccomyxa sp. Obi]|nr:Nucleoporin GLE1 [Coccomyxa sp. Obi]